jgi:Holliday junction resolvasome RuvABC endonuclease subunit
MILGIDPGLSGALAFMDDELLIYDIPTFEITRNGKNKRQIDLQALLSILKMLPVEKASLENVNAMPGQGVSSMFQMGRGYGQIEMALAACNIPVTYVTPQVWKKALQVPKDKDGARQRASQLMPQWAYNWDLKKHDGRAEAALIALYGSKQ